MQAAQIIGGRGRRRKGEAGKRQEESQFSNSVKPEKA